jgi:dephospho-CoA kinase
VSLRLGLTGGIASGKSTVAAILAKAGASVIDADAISRKATALGGLAIPKIREAFGPEFIDDSGALDRKRMRELAFQDLGARQVLEGIVHPLVGQEIALQAKHAQNDGASCIVFDIPLLIESPYWRTQLDKILVVDCSIPTQRERVAIRNMLSDSEISRILQAQATRSNRLHAADAVIFNDGVNLKQLELAVLEIVPVFGL